MKKLIYSIAFFIVLGVTVSSCGKKGCTDENATNVCDNCKKDDGSCSYEGKYVFWYGEDFADSARSYGITTLTFYVDGSKVGVESTDIFWTGAPACDQSGSTTATKSLGSSKSKSFSYELKDELGIVWDSGTLNFEANTCIRYELTW